MQAYLPIFLTLAAAILFSLATLVFTVFSKSVSLLWMNTFKALVAGSCFALVVQTTVGWHTPTQASLLAFLGSGIIGLGFGDLLLFKAFTIIGPARTLMLFGFAPIFNGVIGYFAFGQEIGLHRFLAILCMIACLVVFAYEGFRASGRWEVKGLLLALGGVFLDASGIGLTRFGFEHSPNVSPEEGNFYRCLGAFVVLYIVCRLRPVNLLGNFRRLSARNQLLVLSGCILGSFLSLWCFLTAVRTGHLATISAIGATGPMFAALFEAIFFKIKPSRYLFIAFAFFVLGFAILLRDAW